MHSKYDRLLIATGCSNRHLKINGEIILPEENIIYLYIFLDLQILLRSQADIVIANWQLVYISLIVWLLAQ